MTLPSRPSASASTAAVRFSARLTFAPAFWLVRVAAARSRPPRITSASAACARRRGRPGSLSSEADSRDDRRSSRRAKRGHARGDQGGIPFWVSGQYASLAAVPQDPGVYLPVMVYYFQVSASVSKTFQRGFVGPDSKSGPFATHYPLIYQRPERRGESPDGLGRSAPLVCRTSGGLPLGPMIGWRRIVVTVGETPARAVQAEEGGRSSHQVARTRSLIRVDS
jgi:hypothetical protein